MNIKVYIESLNNFPINDCGVSALQGFRDNQANIIFFEDIEEVPTSKYNILVGCIETTNKYFERFGLPPKRAINIPDELHHPFFLQRKVWTTTMKNFRNNVPKLPVFIKPDGRAKEFIAGVMTRPDTVYAFKDVPDDSPVLLSEVVNMLSEWRCYVINGEVRGVKHYSGDPWLIPDKHIVQLAVKQWKSQPSAYAIDFAVLENGRTALVEANDGWSLGNYGLEHTVYAKLLSTRWMEIMRSV